MTKRVDQAVVAAMAQLRKASIPLPAFLKPKDGVQFEPEQKLDARVFCSLEEGLTVLYEERLLPLETETQFHYLSSHSRLVEADFYAKPIVLIVGPYSGGKTSLIERLLGRPYPGMRVGPEPTTDRFTIIGYAPKDSTTPGGTLIVPSMRETGSGSRGRGEFPKMGLERFGAAFLDKLIASSLDAEILKNITIIDTPGVISGTRSYDYLGAMKWFGERSDLIIVMMDALKPEITDELKAVLESLKKYTNKMRFVINKADEVTSEDEFLRVYRAIIWSLGQVLCCPDVPEVFLGSFWSRGIREDSKKAQIFSTSLTRLDDEIAELPSNAALRKLDQMMRRARQVKAHAHLISFLKENFPSVLKKGASTRLSTSDLQDIYEQLVSKMKISMGDLPDAGTMRKKLRWSSDLNSISPERIPILLGHVEHFINVDIPVLMEMAQRKEPLHVRTVFGKQMRQVIAEHITVKQMAKYKEMFKRLSSGNGDGVMGLTEVRAAILEENCGQPLLDSSTFSMFWNFVDLDRSERFDLQDFQIFMHLVDHWRHDEKSSCVSLVERLTATTFATTSAPVVGDSQMPPQPSDDAETRKPCGDA